MKKLESRTWCIGAPALATIAALALAPNVALAQVPTLGKPTTQSSVDGLNARIAALESRLKLLEDRVKKLEDKPDVADQPVGEKVPKEILGNFPKNLKVRAPFTVVDDRDRPLVRIEVNEDAPLLTMMGGSKGHVEFTPNHLSIQRSEASQGGIRFGVGDSGKGFLLLRDNEGGDAVTLGYLQTDNRLSFKMYANNNVMVELGENANDLGSGSLKLGNGRGNFSAELGTNPRNEMALRIRGGSTAVVAGLGVNPGGDGGGALKIADRTGKILASVETKEATGHVNVFGTDGKARANMGAEADGRGFVRIGASENLEAASLTVDPATSGGQLHTRSSSGIGATVGTKMGPTGLVLGDLCVNSSRQKGTCFSAVAIKSLLVYF